MTPQLAIAPLSAETEDSAVALIRQTFGDAPGRLYRSLASQPPGGRRDWCWTMVRGTDAVSHVQFVPRRMSIGETDLPIALIGWVATRPEERGRGHVRLLMERGMAALGAEGVALCCVIAVPGLYEHFGFADAFGDDRLDSAVVLPIDHAASDVSVSGAAVRAARESDLPVLGELYEKTYSREPGSFRRDQAHWRWLWDGWDRSGELSPEDWLVLPDAHDQPLGYAVIARSDPNGPALWEAAGRWRQPGLTDQLLSIAASRANSVGASELSVKLPLTHPLTVRALRSGAVTRGYNFAALARVVRLDVLGEGLADAFTARWPTGRPSDVSFRLMTELGDLAFRHVSDRVELIERAPDEESAVLELPQATLSRLATGYVSIVRAYADPGVRVVRGERSWWMPLFPRRSPVLNLLDGPF